MRELCAFENNSVVSYGKMYMLYALENGFAYFDAKKEFGTPREYELMCMNLATGDVEYLETIPSFAWSGIIYSADGTCYIPKDDRPGEPIVEYYIAKDATLSEPVEMAERYMLGSNQYAIEKGDLIRYDEAGNREVVKDYVELGFHCLIPCESGLLVFRHGSSYVLDYIPEDTQTVVELFHYRGFASNAGVNIHDNYVYISCEMFDKLGEKGTEKGSAAPFDGTYRISLTDYTVEKLNDVFYDGLYIYDDTGIYATKVGCIYKLDFDGNVIMTLME